MNYVSLRGARTASSISARLFSLVTHTAIIHAKEEEKEDTRFILPPRRKISILMLMRRHYNTDYAGDSLFLLNSKNANETC